MSGKKCQVLRNIRLHLAEEHHIPWKEEPCTSPSACTGTCPWCEKKIARLERMLLGAALSTVLLTGCIPEQPVTETGMVDPSEMEPAAPEHE